MASSGLCIKKQNWNEFETKMYQNIWICSGAKVYEIRILVEVKTPEELFLQLNSIDKKVHFQI